MNYMDSVWCFVEIPYLAPDIDNGEIYSSHKIIMSSGWIRPGAYEIVPVFFACSASTICVWLKEPLEDGAPG